MKDDSGKQHGSGRLRDQVVIITGGASGIGRATAQAMAVQGAHVVVVDVSDERIASTLGELAGGAERHLGLDLDVKSESAMEEMARVVVERFGRIDTLVACAGVLRGRGSSPKPLYKISAEEWDYVLQTNLRGMFLANKAVLPAMIRQRQGNIVNLSSVSGRQGRAHDAPYCASKFGVIGMSEALAEEARHFGVRVQIVVPDAVRTPIWEQNGPIPCPEGALPPERVADLIVTLVTLPWDTMIVGATIAPFRARQRKKRETAAAEQAANEATS